MRNSWQMTPSAHCQGTISHCTSARRRNSYPVNRFAYTDTQDTFRSNIIDGTDEAMGARLAAARSSLLTLACLCIDRESSRTKLQRSLLPICYAFRSARLAQIVGIFEE